MVADFDVSRVLLSAQCYISIASQIGVLSKGFLVGRSTPGHLILLECGQTLAAAAADTSPQHPSAPYSAHPV